MKIIWKLIRREIRQKPGRFVTLAAGMTAAVFLITVVTTFSNSCLYAMIQQEFTRICQQMDKNIPLETSLADMAKRSGDEDIRQFAEILILAKRSGGGVIQMIRESMERIQRRIETNYEIDAMLSAKKSEFRMMCLIPAGIILYMKLFSTGFMAALYHNAGGVLFMSVCLAAYLAGIFWGRKILDIPV